MAFYKYQVVKKGVVTNEWTSEFAGEGYYEPCFGFPEREKQERECTPEEIASAISSRQERDPFTSELINWYRLPAEYTVIKVDIQSEIDSENAKRTQLQTLKQGVKAILQKADADVTAAEVKTALLRFLRAALLKGDLD
jgi:hypothetical protein